MAIMVPYKEGKVTWHGLFFPASKAPKPDDLDPEGHPPGRLRGKYTSGSTQPKRAKTDTPVASAAPSGSSPVPVQQSVRTSSRATVKCPQLFGPGAWKRKHKLTNHALLRETAEAIET